MKVLRVENKQIDNVEKKFWEDHGVIIHQVSPTLLSALSALRIAKEVDKNEIDIVEVYRQEDAIAAVSAKSIARNRSVKVIFKIEPNYRKPRNLHREVLRKVDGWILPSTRQDELFKDDIKSRIVIPPASIFNVATNPPKFDGKITLAWIGEIRNTDRLKDTMSKVDSLKQDVNLRISGAGIARDVMPAVRFSRSLTNTNRIVWVGEEYNKVEEINRCQAAIQTDNDIILIETEILKSGRRVIMPEQIESFIESPNYATEDEIPSAERYASKLRSYYSDIINNY